MTRSEYVEPVTFPVATVLAPLMVIVLLAKVGIPPLFTLISIWSELWPLFTTIRSLGDPLPE
jgi:hypothetical protein